MEDIKDFPVPPKSTIGQDLPPPFGGNPPNEAGKLPQESDPSGSHLSKSKVFLLIAAFAFSAFWTIIIPGVWAFCAGVYTKNQVVASLEETYAPDSKRHWLFVPHDPVERRRLNILIKFGKEQREALFKRFDYFNNHPSLPSAKSILSLDSNLKDSDKILPSIQISGFAENTAKYIWFFNTFAMLSLIVLVFSQDKGSNGKVLPLIKEIWSWLRSEGAWPWGFAFALYCLLEVPHLFQKLFVLNGVDMGRVQYTYVNPDIDFISFILEESRTALFFLEFVALILVCRRELARISRWTDGRRSVPTLLTEANIQFQRWQILSFALAAAFIPWTYFFWDSIKGHGDVRFAYIGFCIHILWGFAWVMLSSPMICVFRKWSEKRLELSMGYFLNGNFPGSESLMIGGSSAGNSLERAKFFLELSPVSNYRLIFSSIVAIFSFLLPILNAIQ